MDMPRKIYYVPAPRKPSICLVPDVRRLIQLRVDRIAGLAAGGGRRRGAYYNRLSGSREITSSTLINLNGDLSDPRYATRRPRVHYRLTPLTYDSARRRPPRFAAGAASGGSLYSVRDRVPGEGLPSGGGVGSLGDKCPVEHFWCADGSRCLPAAWRCDGRAHCADASDELHCTWNATCGAGQFRCERSGLCVAAGWRCDGDADCGPHDDSDENPYMCEKEFRCGGNEARCETPLGGRFSCVPVAAFCDARRDCVDGSDEWDICDNFTRSQCGALGCAHGCRPTHQGLACYCPEGYEPSDGRCIESRVDCDVVCTYPTAEMRLGKLRQYTQIVKTLEMCKAVTMVRVADSDECAREDTCAQLCVNSAGSYACACAAGYTLQPDGSSCIADDGEEPFSLVVGTAAGVARVWPRDRPPRVVTRDALDVRAIDFLYDNRSVCYVHSNVSRASIVCVPADNMTHYSLQLPTPALFPDVDSVSHLAIEWVSRDWYVYDESREVLYVCEATGRFCRLLLDGLSKLHGLALDPLRGLMFWSVWGAVPPAVMRAGLGGGERRALAAHKLVYPGPPALDLVARHVYWPDAYLECVERADYEGKHRTTVLRGYSVSL
ncbi:Low-density lipoprotein receptor-related protein 1 [Papilio machaon]|uniref:Low-density lipoprotein receptor-related protein 1 n=1 Tax=Papilio machaon TaxID=76193 RepID=A0A0N0PCN6_PAPMA|nr:Low-density lipoprotein receptor-related protein 1 [Papilio machaon]